jgi:hypothetical protein
MSGNIYEDDASPPVLPVRGSSTELKDIGGGSDDELLDIDREKEDAALVGHVLSLHIVITAFRF